MADPASASARAVDEKTDADLPGLPTQPDASDETCRPRGIESARVTYLDGNGLSKCFIVAAPAIIEMWERKDDGGLIYTTTDVRSGLPSSPPCTRTFEGGDRSVRVLYSCGKVVEFGDLPAWPDEDAVFYARLPDAPHPHDSGDMSWPRG